jgi:hypothetical protein
MLSALATGDSPSESVPDDEPDDKRKRSTTSDAVAKAIGRGFLGGGESVESDFVELVR